MPEGIGALTAALAGRYTLERELGAGGMATVYLATDLKHKRPVAVKVLREELSATLGADRFLREIETTANLRHPHILPLYDSGTGDGGLLYYVMPFVEGESLRGRMSRESKLPLEFALQVTLEAADALAYAHARGVVHRDIKPDNILIDNGHAVLADFGIARAIDVAGGGTRATQVGLAVGTPAYMSPEQASGEREIDGRSDLYSLGCVLFEMLAGEPAFSGLTAQAVIAKRFIEEAPELARGRAWVPSGVSRAVARLLRREPAERYGTGAELVSALKAVDRSELGPEAKRDRSLAVLPFANRSPDPDSAYFSDGITEDLINALGRLPGVRVASRSSSFAFQGQALSMPEVARKLNVATVLEGSVRKAGNRVRITAQLVDVASDTHLWSERYDRDLDDIFAVQDDIASAIVEQLKVTLTSDAPLVKTSTVNADAYNLYLKGRHLWLQRGQAMLGARDAFQQAIDIAPDFALAHAGLCDAVTTLGVWGFVPTAEVHAVAAPAAQRALALSPELPEGDAAMALYQSYTCGDLRDADVRFRRVARALPNNGVNLGNHTALLGFLGSAETLVMGRRALALEPMSKYVCGIVSFGFCAGGHFDEAQSVVERGLAISERYGVLMWMKGTIELDRGEWARAAESLEVAAEWTSRSRLMLPTLGVAYHRMGREADFHRIHAELVVRREAGTGSTAFLELATGRIDEGFASLGRLLAERGYFPWATHRQPGCEWLAGDARYRTLLDRYGYGWVLQQGAFA